MKCATNVECMMLYSGGKRRERAREKDASKKGKVKKTKGNIFHHPFLFDTDGIWVGMGVYTVYIDVTTDVGMDVGNGCRE